MNQMRAVFFDKDGTLIEDVPYNVNLELIKLREGASEALALLKKADFKLFVVSNQSGVARGYFEEKDLQVVWQKLNELTGVEFDGFYYCPHYPNGKIEAYSFACGCRKPQPGMILEAAEQHGIDLAKSWFVGDTRSDVEAGKHAGCQTIFLEIENTLDGSIKPDFTVKTLLEAAQIIIKSSEFQL
jgi:D-glycero-D-manno-heptose 1,7-bisphosphate phosphatase